MSLAPHIPHLSLNFTCPPRLSGREVVQGRRLLRPMTWKSTLNSGHYKLLNFRMCIFNEKVHNFNQLRNHGGCLNSLKDLLDLLLEFFLGDLIILLTAEEDKLSRTDWLDRLKIAQSGTSHLFMQTHIRSFCPDLFALYTDWLTNSICMSYEALWSPSKSSNRSNDC